MKTKVIWLVVGVVLNWNINVMKAQFNKGNKAMQYWGSGAMWITRVWVTASPPANDGIYYYLQSMRDTIIQGKKYYKANSPLYSWPILLGDTSFNYIKIHYYDINYSYEYGNDFFFDFSATQAGDSTQAIRYIWSSQNTKYKIDSIWQESDGVRNYAFYRVNDIPPYYGDVVGFKMKTVWVKDIGSLDGGFANFGYHDMLATGEFCGLCFSYNDTIRYLNIPPYIKSISPKVFFGVDGYYVCHTIGSVVSIRGRCDTLSAFKGKIVGVNMLEQAEEWVSIYPNPVSDVLHIEGMESTMDIVLYNISGEVVKKINFHGEKLHIPMQDIPPGFYLMELKLDNTKIIRRKIVKR